MSENASHPSPEHLAAYADLSLSGLGRLRVRQHLRRCPDCAQTTLALQRAFSDVRALHQQGGWRAAAQSALRRETVQGWEAHCAHCWRCRWKTGLGRLWFGPQETRRPALTIGIGGMLIGSLGAFAVVALLPPHDPEVIPKGISFENTSLAEALQPPESQLAAQIEQWAFVAERFPELPEPHLALSRLKHRQAEHERDPQRRATLEQQAAEHRRQADQSLGLELTAPQR